MKEREQRIFEARRAGLVARVADSGIGFDRAEALFEAYDAEVTERGVTRNSQGYWDEAERSIAWTVSGRRRETPFEPPDASGSRT